MNDDRNTPSNNDPLFPPSGDDPLFAADTPSAFAPDAAPPPPPPLTYASSVYATPPAMGQPASNPGGSAPRRRRRSGRKVLIASGVAVALLALVAGGIALAASQATTPSSTAKTTPATTTQNAPATGKRAAVIYTVTAINGGAITATASDTSATVTIATSAQTAIVRAGQPANLSDIAAGAKLRVEGHKKAGNITAKKIEIIMPSVEGKVTAIGSATITVKSRQGAVTVNVSGATVIVDARTRQTVALSAIQPGEKVHAEGALNSDGSLSALYILVGTKTSAGAPPAATAPAA